MGISPSKPTPACQLLSADSDNEKLLSAGMSDLRISDSQLHPHSPDGTLALTSIGQWEQHVQSNSNLTLARTILTHTNINDALTSRSSLIATPHIFNHDLSLTSKTLPITNQKSSGRCWLFATTNVIRHDVMKKLHLEEFQLSQSYLFFWDKLNKANYYLELSIELADRPVDDRLVSHLAQDLVSDGGQWDMVVNLLAAYGVVPQSVYPESTHSSLSGPLNKLLKTKLREYALALRTLSSSLRAPGGTYSAEEALKICRAKKEEQMKDIYVIISNTLGPPPSPTLPFTWEYTDDSGHAHSWTGTPLEFYKSFSSKTYPPTESFSLINDPRNAYNKLYTVDKLGNVWGPKARPVLYVNTEIENMKKMVVKMIKAGQPVFFGCDVGQTSDRVAGVMDTGLFSSSYADAFDITLTLTKAQRLLMNESAMTHAMVISGVHLSPTGEPVRYKVENSWGDAVGDKGYFVMTDRWFEEFVYQVVVPRGLATKEMLDVWDAPKEERVVLPLWDPMGALA